MDPRHLRVLVEVARRGSMGGAARALSRTQPAVSMTLRALQEALGVPLFERVGRRNRLTPAGHALVERAVDLLDELDALPRRLSEDAGRAVVRVGSGEGVALYVLPGRVRALKKRLSEVQVVVHNQPAEDTLAMLKHGDLDFGLRSLESVPAWAEYRPCLRVPRVVIAPPGHPVLRGRRPSLAALARFPFVMPRREATNRALVESACHAAGLACRLAFEGGGWEVIKRYVRLGLGIAVVPALCVRGRQDTAGLGVRSVEHLFGQETYGILVRRGRSLPPAARELIALVEGFGAQAERGQRGPAA